MPSQVGRTVLHAKMLVPLYTYHQLPFKGSWSEHGFEIYGCQNRQLKPTVAEAVQTQHFFIMLVIQTNTIGQYHTEVGSATHRSLPVHHGIPSKTTLRRLRIDKRSLLFRLPCSTKEVCLQQFGWWKVAVVDPRRSPEVSKQTYQPSR